MPDLVLQLKSAAQLQSVIAHEAAHISNGHISRRLANAQAGQYGPPPLAYWLPPPRLQLGIQMRVSDWPLAPLDR